MRVLYFLLKRGNRMLLEFNIDDKKILAELEFSYSEKASNGLSIDIIEESTVNCSKSVIRHSKQVKSSEHGLYFVYKNRKIYIHNIVQYSAYSISKLNIDVNTKDYVAKFTNGILCDGVENIQFRWVKGPKRAKGRYRINNIDCDKYSRISMISTVDGSMIEVNMADLISLMAIGYIKMLKPLRDKRNIEERIDNYMSLYV